MFLHQKFGYEVVLVTTLEEADEMVSNFVQSKPPFVVFDTETTGLNYLADTPFMFIFGFNKSIYVIDLLHDMSREIMDYVYICMELARWAFAHNTKYDWHMMYNYDYPIPKSVALADGFTIARLTNFVDESFSKSLETMGTLYVDDSAKFAGRVIKNRLSKIKSERKEALHSLFKVEYPRVPFGRVWAEYHRKVPFIAHEFDEYFAFIDEYYQEPNYLDVYTENPELMNSYGADDAVILLEWLGKALPVLHTVDPGLITFQRECDLLVPVAKMERVGFKVDTEYLLSAHTNILTYQERLYNELYGLLGEEITVGQHKRIKEIFLKLFGVSLDKVDKSALTKAKMGTNVNLDRAVDIIIELRTIDKWLSTYIEGALKKVYEGRIHTKSGIDNAGAVSGRVSSDLQQQPKEALEDMNGNELFHPRKLFLAEDDRYLVSFDYSQQELRVQAYYTLLTSDGDEMLLKAYIPFKCVSSLTNEVFDPTVFGHLERYNSGEWIDPTTNKPWTPTDVHDETTFNAFPELNGDANHPEFKHMRRLGKMCNFLKNYQGGLGAIMEQLEVSEEIARKLDTAYYDTFPMIKEYQNWTVKELRLHGFVENLFGRRYYFKNSRWHYRASNYLVQGSCADMIKEAQLEIHELLKGSRSEMVLPVHDELLVYIHHDETHFIDKIKAIMEDVPQVLYVPMVCDVEYSTTNWAKLGRWEL